MGDFPKYEPSLTLELQAQQILTLQKMISDCLPYMREDETPAECIERAIQGEGAALDKYLTIKRGLRDLMRRVE